MQLPVTNPVFPAALRRVATVACAIVLILITFAHGIQHPPASAAAAGTPLAISLNDGSPDAPANDPAGHCPACAMVAIELLLASVLPEQAATVKVSAKLPNSHAHPLAPENPPPITSI